MDNNTPLGSPPNRLPQVPPGPPGWQPQVIQPIQPPAPAAPVDVIASVAPVSPTPLPTLPPVQPTAVQAEPFVPPKLGSQDAVPIGISASSLGLNGAQHPPLPIGIYIIAGLTLLNFFAVFFNTNTNPFYSIVMVFDLLVAIGLFSKLEMARKLAFYVQVLSIASILIVVGLLVSLQLKANQDYTKFHQAISEINTTTASPEQKTEIADLEAQVQKARDQLGHVVIVAYIRDGISLAASIGIVIYLTRPGVKEAFHT